MNEIVYEKIMEHAGKNQVCLWFLVILELCSFELLIYRLTKLTKIEKTQRKSPISGMKWDITEAVAIGRIIKEYSEHLFTHRCDNLEEVGHFFKNYQLSKLSPDDTDNLNSPRNH